MPPGLASRIPPVGTVHNVPLLSFIPVQATTQVSFETWPTIGVPVFYSCTPTIPISIVLAVLRYDTAVLMYQVAVKPDRLETRPRQRAQPLRMHPAVRYWLELRTNQDPALYQ